MKHLFRKGDNRIYTHTITTADAAAFASGTVHEVYSTFALARDAEWSGRLFVLEMKDEGEEGIGTAITVAHHAPALIGETVVFTASFEGMKGNEVATSFKAMCGERLIASGTQLQKIVRKEKLSQLFDSLKSGTKD